MDVGDVCSITNAQEKLDTETSLDLKGLKISAAKDTPFTSGCSSNEVSQHGGGRSGPVVWLLSSQVQWALYNIRNLCEAFRNHPLVKQGVACFRAVLVQDIALTIKGGRLGVTLIRARTPEDEKLVGSELPIPDAVFVRVLGMFPSRDNHITLLRHLEKAGAIVTPTSRGITNAINKFWTFQELALAGVPLPDTTSYASPLPKDGYPSVDELAEHARLVASASALQPPLVVKSVRGSQGDAVHLVDTDATLQALTAEIDAQNPLLFQKYVAESHGCNVRVLIVGGKFVGAVLKQSCDGRMQSNCAMGGKFSRYELPESTQRMCERIAAVLDLEVCGIDLLFSTQRGHSDADYVAAEESCSGGFVVCEVNGMPGFESFDVAHGTKIAVAMAEYTVRRALEKHQREAAARAVARHVDEV